jgi:hypothetical protein
MIAKISFPLFGEPAEATLTDDLEWECKDATVQGALNSLLRTEDKSPARGFWEVAHVNDMAQMLKATKVEFEPKEPLPAGTIY